MCQTNATLSAFIGWNPVGVASLPQSNDRSVMSRTTFCSTPGNRRTDDPARLSGRGFRRPADRLALGREVDPQHQLADHLRPQVIARRHPAPPPEMGSQSWLLL